MSLTNFDKKKKKAKARDLLKKFTKKKKKNTPKIQTEIICETTFWEDKF